MFNPRYTIIRMDRRYTYREHFEYIIEFKRHVSIPYIGYDRSGVIEFDRCRRWFNEKFGWSQDVVTRDTLIEAGSEGREGVNQTWAYSVQYDQYRIYVRDDTALSWFLLSHPQENDVGN